HIMDTFNGIILAMTYVSLPIMFDTLKIGFKAVNEELELVARSLGASKIKAFTTITLPLIKRNILAGSLLTWARAMSEVGSILIIAYYPKTINIVILEAFQTYGLKYAAILSAVLITISLVVFIALRMVYRE
ncbi:MAG: ABC transporter permease subunit, partial [Crenarchaeota archaeon]|nr:ABC transporter permease subunit [Thermoproteota archaeon]